MCIQKHILSLTLPVNTCSNSNNVPYQSFDYKEFALFAWGVTNASYRHTITLFYQVFARFARAIASVEKSLNGAGYGYAHTDHLGYITTCPSNGETNCI